MDERTVLERLSEAKVSSDLSHRHGRCDVDYVGALGAAGINHPTGSALLDADLTQSSAATGQVPTWNGSAWAPATPSAGGSPGGSDTQVQFNDGGSLAGASNLTWNKSTNTLSIANGVQGTANLSVLNGRIQLGSADFSVGFWASGWGIFDGSSSLLTIRTAGSAPLAATANSTRMLIGNTAGQVQINNGTTGTYRDLILRNLIGTGNLATGTVSKSADYTATTDDGTIEVNASGAGRTITLFAASGNAGKILVIKKTDSSANAVTVDANASETIDGATTVSLASQYSTITIQVNAAGTAWHKISGV